MQRAKSTAQRKHPSSQKVARFLFWLGGLFFLAGLLYTGYVILQNWVARQNHYIAANRIAPLLVPTITPTATPSPTPTPLPTPTITPTPKPMPRPIQISIPAIGVKSPIVSVPMVVNPITGATEWQVERLFRGGRTDVVGHLEGTLLPGQPGNSVLGGHNYGYGYNGVFVNLGRLREGDRIIIVTDAGVELTYEVISVEGIPWRRRTEAEMARHLEYLSLGGEERLTLVSCGGSNVWPFPERIYVVAKPIDDF